MATNKKIWNYALVAVSIMAIIGIGTAYAVPLGTSFEEFCETATSNNVTNASDFICEADIFQMKIDIEQMQENIEDLENNTYKNIYLLTYDLTVDANSRSSVGMSCFYDDAVFMNIGFDPQYIVAAFGSIPEVYIERTSVNDDQTWGGIGVFNPTTTDKNITVKMTCIGP